MSALTLHTYWRSTASYRVRIAAALKGMDFRLVTHDLRTGEQDTAAYLALNPQGLLPALETDGAAIWQSSAIMEWIEETCPDPPLLPRSVSDRAMVRAMAATICCDIHPLNNLRVLHALRQEFAASEQQVGAWIAYWITAGFAALEQQIGHLGGEFAFGDTPTFADCCLIPQVYSAERFAVDLTPYPNIRRIAAHCVGLPAFREAHPAMQPDAPAQA